MSNCPQQTPPTPAATLNSTPSPTLLSEHHLEEIIAPLFLSVPYSKTTAMQPDLVFYHLPRTRLTPVSPMSAKLKNFYSQYSWKQRIGAKEAEMKETARPRPHRRNALGAPDRERSQGQAPEEARGPRCARPVVLGAGFVLC